MENKLSWHPNPSDRPNAWDGFNAHGTKVAFVGLWTKDGAYHVALPDPSRGAGMFWTDATFQDLESAKAHAESI